MFRFWCYQENDKKKDVVEDLMDCLDVASQPDSRRNKLIKFSKLERAIKAVADAKRIPDLNKPNDSFKPLHFIARSRYCSGQVWLNVARDLLVRGVDPNVPDHYGFVPLHYAFGCQDLNMAYVLVMEHKADLEFKTTTNQTVLLKFLDGHELGKWESLHYLLSHGADMTAMDDTMSNMFHLLATNWAHIPEEADDFFRQQDKEKIRQLLESKDENGNTPLHIVCSQSKLSFTISERLEYYLSLYQFVGADFTIPNHAGFSPIFCLIDQMESLGTVVVNEGIETFFEMGVDCFQTTMLTYVDGLKKPVTPLEYARIRELPKPDEENQESKVVVKVSLKADEVHQALKVSEFILACMVDGKYELSRRYQNTAFLMARHRNPSALSRLPNPLARLIFSFLKPVESKAGDVKDAEAPQKAERSGVRWHG